MKRRKLIQYGALSSTSFFLNTGFLNHPQKDALSFASISTKRLYDWIILYWMPEDNNLSRFGIPILQMLSRGVQSENILVVVESDFSGAKHLSRNLITFGNVDIQKLDTANSGSEKVFTDYLNWAKSLFEAKKWAIVFLGHGGRLDEISPDEHPEPGLASEPQWMNIKKLSDIIANFNRQVDNRVELVFFQNCNKGTIEAHYTFRDTAKYTLSSQIMLGAPNYYYEPMLQFLGREPDINGGELAKMIMEFERSDMYHSYTVTNNHAVFALPAIIIPLINSVIASSKNDVQLSEVNLFHYMDNRFVDVISFFKTITKQSGADMEIYKKIVKYIKNSIIYNFKQNGKLLGSRAKYYQNLSGLNIFLPTSRQEFDKYRYLPVFSELKLAELFNAILFN